MRNYARARERVDGHNDRIEIPRVCLLTETFHPVVGGGETHARLLATHLNSLGMSTFVLTRRTDPQLPRSAHVDGTLTYRLPPSGMKRFGKYAMLPAVLNALCRRQGDYDIILVCGFRVLGLPALIATRRFGKVCVLRAESPGEMSGGYASVHGAPPRIVDSAFSGWISYRNRILRNAHAFVSISTQITEELERSADSDRVYRIDNGIDTSLFRPVDREHRHLLRKRLGLPLDDLIAVYSGKLNKGKGLEYLLQAVETISCPGRDLHLALVGSGGGQSISVEDELRRQVSKRGLQSRVSFIGYVENVHEYLQASDLFVLPSESEGLPMSMLEAMACGVPVVVTQVGGIPEAVHQLENGILVPPRDSDALARSVMELAQQPSLSQSLAENGRRTVCERYSIKAVAREYHTLFMRLHSEQMTGKSQ